MKRRKVSSHALSGERPTGTNNPQTDRKRTFLLPAVVALALLCALLSWVYTQPSSNDLLFKPPSTAAKIPPFPAAKEEGTETYPVSITAVIDEETYHLVEKEMNEEGDEVADDVVVNGEDVATETSETVSMIEPVIDDDRTIPTTAQWNEKMQSMMQFFVTQLESIQNMLLSASISFKLGNVLESFEQWEAIIMPFIIQQWNNVRTIVFSWYKHMDIMLVPALTHRYHQICGVFVSVITHLSHNNILAKCVQTIRALYTKYFSEYVQHTLLPQIRSGVVDIQSIWVHITSLWVSVGPLDLSDDTRARISTILHSCNLYLNQLQFIPALTKASLSRWYLIIISWFTQHVLPVLLPLVDHFHHFFWNLSRKVVEFTESYTNVHDMGTYSFVMIGLVAVAGVVFVSG